MHSRLQNHTVHRRMSCTRREETPGITSFSMSRQRKFHTGMHAHTYRTAATRYVPFSRRLGGISGMDADKQAWLAKYATGPSHDNTYLAPGAQTVDQISAILRDQFGILPKRRTIGYTKPYPSDYDLIHLPPKYRLPIHQVQWIGGVQLHRAREPIFGTIRDDFSIRSLTGEVLLAVFHRASFWMVHFTRPGLDPYMEATRGAVSRPIPLRGC
jgi:hypothetical protein